VFDLDSGVGSVTVTTSVNGNLGPSHWAERAADTIVSVGSNSHPTIAEQAKAFKSYIHKAVQYYIWEAVKEDRSKVITLLRSAGHNDLANSVEKL
jgi:hypothetical protein|tara:strand:+ start:3264 stop:3548 length:285 start_codon:yes stop_codon:yes gene_type:complete